MFFFFKLLMKLEINITHLEIDFTLLYTVAVLHTN